MHPLVFVIWKDLWSPPQALLASPETIKRQHVQIPQQDPPFPKDIIATRRGSGMYLTVRGIEKRFSLQAER